MLPSLIQANGLGATLAFLASKSAKEKDSGGEARGEKAPVRNLEKAEGRLFEDLAAWLTRAEWPSGPYCRKLQEEESSGRLVLLRRLTTNDAQTYRRATVETLALASWLKRLSAALIEKKGKD
jgi:CRISPR type III-B/RAMP module-associated protein Cmr5